MTNAPLTPTTETTLSSEQAHALEMLNSGENVFLTGGAGSGKSFVIRHFMRDFDPREVPILASTGAAAVLVGGRTFHSFFGLGIMDGGLEATLARASRDARLTARLRRVEGIVIDEVSMIPGEALMAAEQLARQARDSQLPWGGMRVIAVGDFAQLPPVAKYGRERDWAFQNDVWRRTGFTSCVLTHNQRVHDRDFLDVLADVRAGRVTERVRDYLSDRTRVHDEDHPAPRLFPRRAQSESYNQRRLDEIPEDEEKIDSIYFGTEKHAEILMKSAPVAPELRLKIGCHVLFLQNDPQKRWINGTRGEVRQIFPDKVVVRKHGGREVSVEKASFALQDAEGNVVASVIQFPLALAYATTIHKSQGATLDELWCDLSALWEPGQAYVALSRLREGSGLHLLKWTPRSIITDPRVMGFYSSLAGPELAPRPN